MQPISASSGGHTDPVRIMTLTEPVFFFKLLLNGGSHDNKIGCISLVWAEGENINFHFCYAQAL